jgi:8-oxo-dGTP diphosphatase
MKEGQKIIDVTCALIINGQNQLLAVQRSSTMSLPLQWELPGGKIEMNETPEDCIIREIQEELSIKIELLKVLESNVHDYPLITINLIPFISKQIAGNIILNEHIAFRWLNANELLDLDWADADIPILYQYLNYFNAI